MWQSPTTTEPCEDICKWIHSLGILTKARVCINVFKDHHLSFLCFYSTVQEEDRPWSPPVCTRYPWHEHDAPVWAVWLPGQSSRVPGETLPQTSCSLLLLPLPLQVSLHNQVSEPLLAWVLSVKSVNSFCALHFYERCFKHCVTCLCPFKFLSTIRSVNSFCSLSHQVD